MKVIDLEVETFAAEIELSEKAAEGKTDPELVAKWYALSVRGYDAHQLLEALHRHVTAVLEAHGDSEYHLLLLGFVAEEVERRRQLQEENDTAAWN